MKVYNLQYIQQKWDYISDLVHLQKIGSFLESTPQKYPKYSLKPESVKLKKTKERKLFILFAGEILVFC